MGEKLEKPKLVEVRKVEGPPRVGRAPDEQMMRKKWLKTKYRVPKGAQDHGYGR